MNARSILALAVACIALSGCVIAVGSDKASHSSNFTSGSQASYASVYAANIGADAITFTVDAVSYTHLTLPTTPYV